MPACPIVTSSIFPPAARALAAVLVVAVGCSGAPADDAGGDAGSTSGAPSAPPSPAADAPAVQPPTDASGSDAGAAAATGAAADAPRVVFIGTSLTAGYGLDDPLQEAWPARVGRLAEAAGVPIEVVNAGVSGDTSAGGLRRVVPLLDPSPAAVVLELGANDGLRGLSLADLRANLDAAVDSILMHAPAAEILLVRMEAPRNLGATYVDGFADAFDAVGARPEVTPVPFLLEGVAGVPELNQADGIHPVAEGHARMAEVAWPVLRRALDAGAMGDAR